MSRGLGDVYKRQLNLQGQGVPKVTGKQPDLLPHKDPLALPGSDTTIDAKDTEEHDR